MIAIYDGTESRLRLIPVSDITDNDTEIKDLISAACWQLPSRIDPFRDEDGSKIEYESPENLIDRFTTIGNRINSLLEKSMYFKDDRYPAVCVNFIFNSYFKREFRYAPRIILSGSTQSGKTRLQNIMAALCYRAFATIKPTFASLFRLIHRYDITPIIDEIQRLKGTSKDDLEDIFLSGDQKNRPIVRTNMNTLKTESFNIYSPMMISKKAGGYTPEDMENRSFSLKMIENRKKEISPTLDLKELESIRNNLYSLYALYCIHPEAFRMEELFDESVRHLTEKDSDGNHVCDFLRSDNTKDSLKGRALDIATTYYPLSRLTGTESEILSLLTEEQHYSAERLKETTESQIFHSLITCCKSYADNYGILGFGDIFTRISTKDVVDTYNNLMNAEGNQRSSMDLMTGHRVTRTLRDLGFEIKKGNANRSFIRWTPDIENVLDTNLDKFGSEEDQQILEFLRKRGMKR